MGDLWLHCVPVGGETTHAILFGHRGLPSAKLFTDLDQLEVGDTFQITVLDRVLVYEVTQTDVVLPEELNGLTAESDKDQVTLVTCTPYGVNSHRLLVRGHRTGQTTELPTDTNDSTPEIVPENALKQSTWTAKYWEGVRDGLFIFLIAIAILLPATLLVKALQKRKRQ